MVWRLDQQNRVCQRPGGTPGLQLQILSDERFDRKQLLLCTSSFCKQKWWSLASAGLQLWFHYSEAERWFSPKPAQIFTTLVKLLPETDVSVSGFRIQSRFLHWNMLLKVGTSLHTCLYLLNESLQNKQIFDYYGLLATELVLQKNPASLKDLQQMTS